MSHRVPWASQSRCTVAVARFREFPQGILQNCGHIEVKRSAHPYLVMSLKIGVLALKRRSRSRGICCCSIQAKIERTKYRKVLLVGPIKKICFGMSDSLRAQRQHNAMAQVWSRDWCWISTRESLTLTVWYHG